MKSSLFCDNQSPSQPWGAAQTIPLPEYASLGTWGPAGKPPLTVFLSGPKAPQHPRPSPERFGLFSVSWLTYTWEAVV